MITLCPEMLQLVSPKNKVIFLHNHSIIIVHSHKYDTLLFLMYRIYTNFPSCPNNCAGCNQRLLLAFSYHDSLDFFNLEQFPIFFCQKIRF